MFVCIFQAGAALERIWTSKPKQYFRERYVKTQLIFPAVRNPRASITHSLAHREILEPDTVFVGMVSKTEHDRLVAAALAAFRARQAEIDRAARMMERCTTAVVRWEDLSPALQGRVVGRDLKPDQCWLWRPKWRRRSEDDDEWVSDTPAPYREFYKRVNGPVPDGVILRHTCDDRRCMNPNHLRPGTQKDNVRDMMSRGRHYRQVIARQRAKKREAYARRKNASSHTSVDVRSLPSAQ